MKSVSLSRLMGALGFCLGSACSGPAPQVDLSIQAAGGQLAYGAATLADAKRQFFGDTPPDDGSGSGGGGGSDLLSPSDPVALHGSPPTVTQLALTRQDDVGGITVTSSLAAGYQHLNGTLPQGFGVLTDPAEISIWAQSLALQVTLGQRQPLPLGLHLDYAAGAGVVRLQAATHLQSALLDLRGRSRQTLPYAVVQARIAGAKGPALQGDLMLFQSGDRELRLGVAQSF